MADSLLDRMITRAVADARFEPAVLRTLLEVPLFAHAPLSDDARRLRLLQFTRPDGLTVIPIFGDAEKAQCAAQGAARVIECPGRQLLEATRGATLMLNPNDTSTTLYPEEIAALLDEGAATIAPVRGHVDNTEVCAASLEDRWIGEIAVDALLPVAGATAVHLLQAWRRGEPPEQAGLLIAVRVSDREAERAARAVGLALAESRRRPASVIDLVTFAPDEPEPAWLDADASRVWRRSG